jgi:phosphatidylserine/phosphatidylglycerophosphate/cardiolipin synthase-like enzyme
MYALTSRPIVTALVSAKRRGVDVRAIVDRNQLGKRIAGRDGVAAGAVFRAPRAAVTWPVWALSFISHKGRYER